MDNIVGSQSRIMKMNWIKENWFRLSILIIFLFLSWRMVDFMQEATKLMERVDIYVRNNTKIDIPPGLPPLPNRQF